MLQRLMQAAAPVLFPPGNAFAPISVRAITTTTSLTTTATINLPAGTVNGDVLVMLISRHSTSATTATVPSGWTSLYNASATNGASIFIKQASGEPSSYSLTLGTGVNAATVSLFALENAQLTQSMTIRHQSGTSTTPTGLSTTPTTDNSIVLAMVTVNATGSVTLSSTWTAPGTEDTDLNSGGPNTSYQSVAHDIQTTAAAITPSDTINFSLAWDMYYFALEHA